MKNKKQNKNRTKRKKEEGYEYISTYISSFLGLVYREHHTRKIPDIWHGVDGLG